VGGGGSPIQPAVPYICCCGSLVTGLCFPVEAVIGAIAKTLESSANIFHVTNWFAFCSRAFPKSCLVGITLHNDG
jgi:hypothetical protein